MHSLFFDNIDQRVRSYPCNPSFFIFYSASIVSTHDPIPLNPFLAMRRCTSSLLHHPRCRRTLLPHIRTTSNQRRLMSISLFSLPSSTIDSSKNSHTPPHFSRRYLSTVIPSSAAVGASTLDYHDTDLHNTDAATKHTITSCQADVATLQSKVNLLLQELNYDPQLSQLHYDSIQEQARQQPLPLSSPAQARSIDRFPLAPLPPNPAHTHSMSIINNNTNTNPHFHTHVHAHSYHRHPSQHHFNHNNRNNKDSYVRIPPNARYVLYSDMEVRFRKLTNHARFFDPWVLTPLDRYLVKHEKALRQEAKALLKMTKLMERNGKELFKKWEIEDVHSGLVDPAEREAETSKMLAQKQRKVLRSRKKRFEGYFKLKCMEIRHRKRDGEWICPPHNTSYIIPPLADLKRPVSLVDIMNLLKYENYLSMKLYDLRQYHGVKSSDFVVALTDDGEMEMKELVDELIDLLRDIGMIDMQRFEIITLAAEEVSVSMCPFLYCAMMFAALLCLFVTSM